MVKINENVYTYTYIELLTSNKFARKRIAKPNFKRAKRFHDELMAVHLLKPKLELNRPIQVGFAILDLSKVHMYGFHYEVWLPKFPQSTLLFTDTDSLLSDQSSRRPSEKLSPLSGKLKLLINLTRDVVARIMRC